jgi:hypothetical protein
MKPILQLITVIICLALPSQAFPQGKVTVNPKSVRIDKKVPTIFIVLERVGTIKNVSGSGEEKRVWLRLKNNSRWLIKLDASGGDKAVEDARLYYEIVDVQRNIKVARTCHVCSIVGLASGKSILFSVPYQELAEGNSLRIQFEYEWEDGVSVAPAIEPVHFVYFYTRHLQEAITAPELGH